MKEIGLEHTWTYLNTAHEMILYCWSLSWILGSTKNWGCCDLGTPNQSMSSVTVPFMCHLSNCIESSHQFGVPHKKPTDLPGFWSWIPLDVSPPSIRYLATWSHLGLQESIILSMKDLIAAPCCGEPFRPWGARNSRRRDRDVLHKAVRWRWYSQDHLRGYPWYLWWWWWLSMVII